MAKWLTVTAWLFQLSPNQFEELACVRWIITVRIRTSSPVFVERRGSTEESKVELKARVFVCVMSLSPPQVSQHTFL